MSATFAGWTEGTGMPSNTPADIQSQVVQLEQLYDKLRSPEHRRIYSLVGHASFVDCHWCKEESDYLTYTFPSILMQYATMGIAFGVGTIAKSKAFWRSYAVIMFVGMAVFEVSVIMAADEIKSSLHDGEESESSFFKSPATVCFNLRWIAFALLCLLTTTRSDTQRNNSMPLVEYIVRTRVLLMRSATYRLAQHAVLSEASVRDRYVAYYRNAEQQRQEAQQNESFQKLASQSIPPELAQSVSDEVGQLATSTLKFAMDMNMLDQDMNLDQDDLIPFSVDASSSSQTNPTSDEDALRKRK